MIVLGQSIIGVQMLGLALFSYTDETGWAWRLQVRTLLLIFPWQQRKIDDKWHAHSTDISKTTSEYLCFYFKVARYRNKTKPIRTITLIKNFKNCLKNIDILDVMGVTTKIIQNSKDYLKQNGTPESSKRKAPHLLVSKHLSSNREDIAYDSSTDSKFSPSSQ